MSKSNMNAMTMATGRMTAAESEAARQIVKLGQTAFAASLGSFEIQEFAGEDTEGPQQTSMASVVSPTQLFVELFRAAAQDSSSELSKAIRQIGKAQQREGSLR